MFKTISAALLAVSVLAAPSLAAAPGTPGKIAHAPVIKTAPFSAKVLNANARWGGHHHHHRHPFHYRHHGHHNRH
jgi:hypothetical protein